ncbi:unnamed protein product [Ilex paraguariensis]|uniref:Sulfotransferase n=1 Tax=Ilex paraguariensis TaxID=185542 RepID=A0ABC8V3X6_9AQUA
MANEESSNPNPDPNSQEALLQELPRERFWEAMDICKWEGFWFEPGLVKPAMTFRSSFEARCDDVLLASTMKTGTTWLKALCLCIMHNQCSNAEKEGEDILTKDSPHFHVQTVETTIYATKPHPDLHSMPSPRLFHSHLPYNLLPDSIKNSDCKIVYIARNPKDTLVSLWHFFNSILRPNQEPFPLEKAVERFCNGVHQYGPFFDHVLQYWLESQKRPQKILFLKYEELKRDPKGQAKRLASFLGRPFTEEEQVDKVLWRCSFERLENLEVNKKGSVLYAVPNSCYFRVGAVGDWKNYLTPEMEEMLNQTTLMKLQGSGLDLEI